VNGYLGSKLIIVEGLTGSGKSTLAHFIARQLRCNGMAANWLHEGELSHPLLADVRSDIETYMTEMLQKWQDFARRVEASASVTVVEACLFNNLIESLMAHNVPRSQIVQYADELQNIIALTNPALIYLSQGDIARALKHNFENRGESFKNFVIRYATGTPYARRMGLEGYEGTVAFWRAFVSMTDELFQRYRSDKLAVENGMGNWKACRRRVLTFLSIPLQPERTISEREAIKFAGTYRGESSGKDLVVWYENGELFVNLFLSADARLIHKRGDTFEAAGWHFELRFEGDDAGRKSVITVGGRDVEYLALVGTIAVRVPG
jgi:hypothetical protein